MADICTPVVSSWLTHIGLWQDKLFCVFKHKGICCWYPNTDASYYDLAITYASKGHFVHEWLYKILPYKVIKNPCSTILVSVATDCCPGRLPSRLHLTITSVTGDCGCLSGVSLPIVWDASFGEWRGTMPVTCGLGYTIRFGFACLTPGDCTGFHLGAICPDGSGLDSDGGDASPGCTCSPLSIAFAGMHWTTPACCTGTFDALVTL